MENEDDVLGLDQPIKLGRVSKIPKISDELLFDNNRGLPQVRKNYTKLLRTIRKNDQAFAAKVLSKGLSKKAAQQLKNTTEVENLEKVLSFYQLWCHGLFPKATFKDCLNMIRDHKSASLKDYRRELLNNEIHRLKVEKGIVVEEPEEVNEGTDGADGAEGANEKLYSVSNGNAISENERQTADISSNGAMASVDEEDDWGFMSSSRRQNNGSFVDDEDEEESSTVIKTINTEKQSNKNIPDDDFDDDFDYDNFEELFPTQQQIVPDDHDHDEELAIMREMGL